MAEGRRQNRRSKLHDKLMPLHTNLFIDSNPAPVKYALSLLGKMDEELRLPMVPVSEPTRKAVRSAMVHAGLINYIQLLIVAAMVLRFVKPNRGGPEDAEGIPRFRDERQRGRSRSRRHHRRCLRRDRYVAGRRRHMPLIGSITGGLDFSNYFVGLSKNVTATNLVDAKKQGAVLAYGSFLTLVINFVIIAFVLFIVIRAMSHDEAQGGRRAGCTAEADPRGRTADRDPRSAQEDSSFLILVANEEQNARYQGRRGKS